MSRFVSSGTDQEPAERDEAWLQAQKAVEARHLEKLEAGKQDGGKSLYETLEANKAAKQEAFEEANRLRNQFRSLDEDEVEFLESIAAEAREKEAIVQREAKVQLESFRALQEEAEKVLKQSSPIEESSTEAWSAGPRKRKQQRESAGIVKKRQISTDKHSDAQQDLVVSISTKETPKKASVSMDAPTMKRPAETTASSKKPLLGLADYSSDDD